VKPAQSAQSAKQARESCAPAGPEGCGDFYRRRVSRREALRFGAISIAGLSLGDLLAAEERGGTGRPSTRSVILLFQFGGASHLDTFDPKPEAPAEVRGEFKAIATRTPGMQICEHLPRLAAIADRFALVRSVHHTRSSHNPAAYYSLTGHEPLIDLVTLNASATDFPHPGAVTDYLLERSGRRGKSPAFVSLPTMIADGPFRTPGEFGGLLGKKHDPLFITSDPNQTGFNLSELRLPAGIGVERVEDRRTILEKLGRLSHLAESPAARDMSRYQSRAIDLLTSPAVQRAFSLHEEPDRVRDRYGRTTYGQSCLLARRLVESGVRFVTVYYSAGIGGWDTHQNNFSTLKDSRLPDTDRAVSALLSDLEARGLLGETLVYWTGDFGRTPKINRTAGRDHWPQCQTVLVAGGGVRGGFILGSSDKSGAFPDSRPVLPDDVTATVYSALGFDPSAEVYDQLGRPLAISRGQPLRELFS
jgi:hypothetical protein